MGKRARSLGALVAIAAAVAVPFAVSAHAPSGAIFTTVADGSEVNLNQYPSKEAVYLDGGPGPGAPQTAAGLADDLHRFLTGVPIVARPAGAAERLLKWTRRHPAVAGLLLSVVLITALGLAGVGWQFLRAQEEKSAALEAKDRAVTARLAEERQRQVAEKRGYLNQIARAQQEHLDNDAALARRSQPAHYCNLTARRCWLRSAARVPRRRGCGSSIPTA